MNSPVFVYTIAKVQQQQITQARLGLMKKFMYLYSFFTKEYKK